MLFAGVDVVEADDSLSKFSSKSLSVIGPFKAALSRPPQPLKTSGLDGVLIIEDEAKGTLLHLMFSFFFSSSDNESCVDGTALVAGGLATGAAMISFSISSRVLVFIVYGSAETKSFWIIGLIFSLPAGILAAEDEVE